MKMTSELLKDVKTTNISNHFFDDYAKRVVEGLKESPKSNLTLTIEIERLVLEKGDYDSLRAFELNYRALRNLLRRIVTLFNEEKNG